MYPQHHFLLGTIFAIILFFLFPQIGLINIAIIILSTVLIDVDHYIYYIYKKRDFSLRKAYHWFSKNQKKFLSLSKEKRDKFYSGIFFLHGIEILIILLFLGLFSNYFFFVFIGFALHLLIDIIWEISVGSKINRISLIYAILKSKNSQLIEEI